MPINNEEDISRMLRATLQVPQVHYFTYILCQTWPKIMKLVLLQTRHNMLWKKWITQNEGWMWKLRSKQFALFAA